MPRFRLSSSVLLATGVAVAATVWMLTGVGGDNRGAGNSPPASGNPPAETSAPAARNPRSERSDTVRPGEPARAMRVTVRNSQAQRLTREMAVSARTQANRSVELRAETEGRIVALGAERGQMVSAGDSIAGIDLRERQARLEEARAQVAYMELQHEATQQLRGQQLAADVQIAESHAQLQTARATLQQIELDIQRTRIVAPFDAIMQERHVELGDFVSIGDTIARLVDTDPMIVVGEVSEREVGFLAPGARGTATAVDGTELEGTVRYLAPVAEESTRTFRIELAVPNPGGALRAGLSAEMRLQADEIDAHFISSALLTLSDGGAIGVKVVDEDGIVRFLATDVVSSDSDGVWVTGLPDTVRIISVGQGFVAPGERVEPVDESGSDATRRR